MTSVMHLAILLIIGASLRPSAAAIADGLLCAYKPQSPDGPTYFEEDGPSLGRIISDPAGSDQQLMRCYEPESYCFTVLSAPDDNSTEAATPILLQGCVKMSQIVAQCGQAECVARIEDVRARTRFCCCRGYMCNANVSLVLVPTTTERAPEPPAEPALSPLLVATVACVTVLCLFAVCATLWCHRRRLFGQKPVPPPPATEPSPFTPTIDLSDLQLGEIIGRGRYGSVRKGILHGEEVAVKIFPAWFRHYFLSERDIYSLPWMESRSLVHFYGADERPTEAGVEYLLVMSHVSQGTLHDFLQANTLQFQQMCQMALTAVRGLAHLHTPIDKHGVVKPAVAHRDVNSRNILVRADGTCCICDLSFAMKISGGRYYNQGEELSAETTSLSDVGTLRYMAPEVLEGAVNLRDCETALKQVDMYAMALVLWELASRCVDPYQGMEVPPYRLPYEAEIGTHPTIDQMQVLVTRNRARPLLPDVWKDTNPALRQLRETIEDSWDPDGEARLTALCMLERISELPLLWERYKGNLGLNGPLPTLNLVIQQQEPEKVKSDVNVTSGELTELEPSETTAETLLTLSPDQEMNLRNAQVSAPPQYVSQIQPYQGRNPCIERNLAAADQSSDYLVDGNTLIERSAAPPNGVLPPESQALLSPIASSPPPARHGATPIPIVQNAVHGGGGPTAGAEPAPARGWLGRLRRALAGRGGRASAQPVPLQPVLPSKTVNVETAGDCGDPERPRSLPL
ncbi:activin receptor type-2A-like [Amphibalanus amphitrite]|uniref:activin receptor type-2A-like n=1 Tax=Amphibalanus amphitrite TaxID=1232801 RepID=UPI001C90DA42|nr:activin receptor type-2A-like [Amphibalanus amphitrite]XP_043247138.1 activin receptor type-2A-like [Amphibalanus amphitrite]